MDIYGQLNVFNEFAEVYKITCETLADSMTACPYLGPAVALRGRAGPASTRR